jgi:hypothetical protein
MRRSAQRTRPALTGHNRCLTIDSMGNVRTLVVWLGLALWASACGNDETPPGPPVGGDDAGVEEDAGGEEDAGQDAGEEPSDAGTDAEPLPDGSNVSECEGDILDFEAARSIGRPLTAALIGNTTHLVYVVPSGGGTSGSNNAQGLRYVSFGTSAEPSEPVDLVNVGIDTYARTRDPFVASRGQALDVVYTSAASGKPWDLFSKDVANEAEPVQETSANTALETGNVAAAFGDALGIVYSADNVAANMSGALMFKVQGEPASEIVPLSQGYHASQIALTSFGSQTDPTGVVGFVSDMDGKRGIFAQNIAADGTASGGLVTLSAQVGGTSCVDIARGRDGAGAIVYTEAPAGTIHQLRFREVDDEGKVGSVVRNLTSGNQNLIEMSIAPYSHGYVVAYRRLGGVPDAAASIYLLFIDAQGNTSGTRLVKAVERTGGGLKVLVANDGRFVVLWADTEITMNPTTNRTEIGLRVKAARLTCAM